MSTEHKPKIENFKISFVYKDCNNINITVSEIVKHKKDYYLDSYSPDYVN